MHPLRRAHSGFRRSLTSAALLAALVSHTWCGVAGAAPEIEVWLQGLNLGPRIESWGRNDARQRTFSYGSEVTAIDAGYVHNVFLNSDGTVETWGSNFDGQTVMPDGGLTGVVAISAGGYHSMALKGDGTVVAWGRNAEGQTTVPAGLNGVTAISAGGSHSMALKGDGTVVAWGLNNVGQTDVPAGLSGVTAIAAGNVHSAALKSDGTVVAWGYNTSGQTNVPAGLSGVTAIAAGGSHTVALQSDGTVVAWGSNTWGQTTVPAGLSGVTAVAAGGTFTVALKSDGTVVAWGNSLSDRTKVPSLLSDVTAICAGSDHTLALTRINMGIDGQVTGATSEVQTLTVKNTGTTPLAIGGASLTGGNPDDFTLNTAGLAATVAPGDSTEVSVTFTPSALGRRQTTLRILNDDSNENPFDISLWGYGTTLPPAVAADSVQIYVGDGVVPAQTGTFSDPEGNSTVTLTSYYGVGTVTQDNAAGTWRWTGQARSSPSTGVVTVAATDSSGAGNTASFTVNVVTRLTAWRAQHFGSTANSGPGADGADPDADGIVNLCEYAFGLPPLKNGSLTPPPWTLQDGNLVSTFAVPVVDSRLTYGAEWSADLVTWTAIPDTPGSGGTHTFTIPAGTPRRYVRHRVTGW